MGCWPAGLLVLFLSCAWWCGGGDTTVAIWRRAFADAAAIRAEGRALLARTSPRRSFAEPVPAAEVPRVIAELSASVRVHVLEPRPGARFLRIEVGPYHGLDVWPDGAAEEGRPLIPGVTWFRAGG